MSTLQSGPSRVTSGSGNNSQIVLDFTAPFEGEGYVASMTLRKSAAQTPANPVSGTIVRGKPNTPPGGSASLRLHSDLFNRISALVVPTLKAFTVQIKFDSGQLTVSDLIVTEVLPPAARRKVARAEADQSLKP